MGEFFFDATEVGRYRITIEKMGDPPPPPQPGSLSVDLGADISSSEHVVTFAPVIAGGTPPYTLFFDYGDGQFGALASHSYQNGDYTALLTVQDSSATRLVASDAIHVHVEHVHPPNPPPPDPASDYIDLGHTRIPRFAVVDKVSVQSGDWGNPNIWSPPGSPGTNEKVRIAAQHVVTVEGITNRVLSVEIEPGAELKHHPFLLSTLQTAYLLNRGCYNQGAIAKLKILAVDPWDEDQITVGFVSLGKWETECAIKDSSIPLGLPAIVGGSSLTLERDPVNWQVGDKIGISGSPQPSEQAWDGDLTNGVEVATIAGLGGNVVYLQSPLQFSHHAVMGQPCTVVMLSHPVVLESESRLKRGHVMIVGHDVDVDVQGAELRNLGRTKMWARDEVTNRAGRYALHIHHCGPYTQENKSRILDNISVWDDGPRGADGVTWPVTIHASEGFEVTNVVAFNWSGSAFVFEDVDARDNILELCYAICVVGSGQPREWNGGSGYQFWSRENLVRFIEARNCTFAAVEHIGGGNVPIQELREVFAVMCGQIHVPWETANLGRLSSLRIAGGAGVYNGYQNENAEYDGVIAETNLSHNPAHGWDFGDYSTHNQIVRNLRLVGHSPCVSIPNTVGRRDFVDLTIPDPEPARFVASSFTVENAELYGPEVGVNWFTPIAGSGVMAFHVPRTVVLRNVRYGPTPTRIRAVCMDGQFQYDPNVLVPDQLYAYQHNGVTGDDFRVYYREQRASYVPKSLPPPGVGSGPPAGLTNQQLHDQWEWNLYLGVPDNPTAVFVYRPTGTAQFPAGVYAYPWRPVCICSELAPVSAVDGLGFGIDGLVARV